jgi:Flp pilus assembly secretin CpaC
MKIEPEVSQLDQSNPVVVAGISVPPLIVRRASTTVELRDGQSFVIGGLLQSEGKNAISQLPWLGDVPVLGALFRSTSYQKNETDLVIIVTPRLVRPMRPGDRIRTPADDTLPPNDADFFLMGKTEIRPEEGRIEIVQNRAVGIERGGEGAVDPVEPVAPVAPRSARGNRRVPRPGHVPCWLKPLSVFGLLVLTTFSSGSRLLALSSDPAPDRREASSRARLLTELTPPCW